MARSPLRLGLLMALVALPALAQTRPSRPQGMDPVAYCRAQCMSVANEGPQLRSAAINAQACAIRCNAAVGFNAQQSRRGSAEATGRGGAQRPVQRTVQRGAPARAVINQSYATPTYNPGVTTRTPAVALIPTADFRTVPAAGNAAVFGVVYAGPAPSSSYGLAAGSTDRMAAYRQAAEACGTDCRLVAEFTGACGAAAQGYKRSPWAMLVTSDPNSFVVTSVSAGSGSTAAQAERQALAECRQRDSRASCRILASSCGRS